MRVLAPPFVAFAVLAALPGSTPASAAFIADLSERLIAITTGFTGTSVLLFGAALRPGSDIAVTVRGPPATAVVRRKQRLGPIWIDGDEVRFANAPTFYAVAASRHLDEIGDPAALADHQVGLDRLVLPAISDDPVAADERAGYRAALFRARQRAGLYTRTPAQVTFLGGQLFRTRVDLPANVPPGTYAVELLQFVDGELAASQRNELRVTKIGLEAQLSDMAVHRAPLYGLISVTLGIAAGWVAAAVFRRG